MIKLVFGDGEIILHHPGGPNIITRALISQKRRQESQSQKGNDGSDNARWRWGGRQ